MTDFEKKMKVLMSDGGITFAVLITSPYPLTEISVKYDSDNSMSHQDNISKLMNTAILLTCSLWQSIVIGTRI